MNRSTKNKPRQETQDVAASQGQNPMWGNPLINSSLIFNSSTERNGTNSEICNFMTAAANPKSTKSNLVKQPQIDL